MEGLAKERQKGWKEEKTKKKKKKNGRKKKRKKKKERNREWKENLEERKRIGRRVLKKIGEKKLTMKSDVCSIMKLCLVAFWRKMDGCSFGLKYVI